MKRNSKRITRLRVKLLPGCLALALGLGTGLFAPAYANTDSRAPTAAILDGQAIAAPLPSDASEALSSQWLQMGRRSSPVPTPSINVTNCNDDGAGSLRAAVGAAVDGDTINMTALACSKITLTTGAIGIGQNNLTLAGPGFLNLEVSGNDASRVFWHLGTGTLAINDLSISHGRKYLNDGAVGNAAGGCVFSSGSVSMDTTWTKYCDAGTADAGKVVRGGAIYAKTNATILNSLVTGNTAHSNTSQIRGAGIYTPGSLFLNSTTVSNNTTSGPVFQSGGGVQVGSLQTAGTSGGGATIKYSTISNNAVNGFGGGVYVAGNVTVSRSTISGNAACRGGGLYFADFPSAASSGKLSNSTVSGNRALCQIGAGGVQIWNEDAAIKDSTIAFNTSVSSVSTKYGAGVRVHTDNTVDLQNTIISNNTQTSGSSTILDDIGGSSGATLTGSNNLIKNPVLPVPSGTISLTDPNLRALANNGGDTRTHMPNFGSVVINAGNNASGATTDQRGSGFPRILGPKADIGSVEFNLSDVIFKNGFD